MANSAANPQPLVLDEEEQITLTGLLLMLLNDDDDLEALQAKTPDSQRLRLRRSRRNQLRFERTLKAEGRGHHEELDIEHPEVLGDRLAAVRSAAHVNPVFDPSPTALDHSSPGAVAQISDAADAAWRAQSDQILEFLRL